MRTDETPAEYVLKLADDILEPAAELAASVSAILVEARSELKEGTSQYKVQKLLSDNQWHCRSCEGKLVASDQYAGGGGIQGLQRGTRKRDGLVIEKKSQSCETCGRKTTWDRWTGETRTANAATSIPSKLVDRILHEYNYHDAVENRQRQKHELVIDHRFPMERWGQAEPTHDVTMSADEIRRKFQLLKKDEGGNHNLLKSRACERCIATGKRGTPMGISFWYVGGVDWPVSATHGPEAETGCNGCGWYDFQAWREALNLQLATLGNSDMSLDSSALAEQSEL